LVAYADVRRLRLAYKQGRISAAEYHRNIAGHIGFAIGMQVCTGSVWQGGRSS
jgi:hypothetical protein